MKIKSTIESYCRASIAICASLLMCASVAPTTLAHMSVAKLTHVSRLILRARCVENATAWDAGEPETAWRTGAVTSGWQDGPVTQT